MSKPNDTQPARSPLLPVRLNADDKIQFNCHKGIACFNACCKNIDITLTPYDIVRLKNRLGMTSYEFLATRTTRFEMDAHGVPGVKLRTQNGSSACQFLTEDGCSVYPDRPTACRYYALGTVSMRKVGTSSEEDFYFVVKEDHCLGHQEPKVQTVREYREEQGVDRYDEANKEWRQIVLKKRSCGPTVGKPSARSLDFFYLCSYDVDGLREFVKSHGFYEVFDFDDAAIRELMDDEIALMQFGFRLLKQVLFGEMTIALKHDARDRRVERRRQLAAQAPKPASE